MLDLSSALCKLAAEPEPSEAEAMVAAASDRDRHIAFLIEWSKNCSIFVAADEPFASLSLNQFPYLDLSVSFGTEFISASKHFGRLKGHAVAEKSQITPQFLTPNKFSLSPINNDGFICGKGTESIVLRCFGQQEHVSLAVSQSVWREISLDYKVVYTSNGLYDVTIYGKVDKSPFYSNCTYLLEILVDGQRLQNSLFRLVNGGEIELLSNKAPIDRKASISGQANNQLGGKDFVPIPYMEQVRDRTEPRLLMNITGDPRYQNLSVEELRLRDDLYR